MCIDWFSIEISDDSERAISGLFSPQNKFLFIKVSHVDFEVAWHFCKTLAWFVSPWKSVRPIPVLRWGWWAVFQHGRLSWAPPSWILNSPPDWLKITAAILDLENNRVYCSQNNSLLCFSAPDWLRTRWQRLHHRIHFRWTQKLRLQNSTRQSLLQSQRVLPQRSRLKTTQLWRHATKPPRRNHTTSRRTP